MDGPDQVLGKIISECNLLRREQTARCHVMESTAMNS